MLSLKKLQDAAKCRELNCIENCSMFTEPDGICGECTESAAKTALAYREMLKQLEWSHKGTFNLYNGYAFNYCPMCGKHKEQGHSDICKLAELLREA
jgi:hypothetical protein